MNEEINKIIANLEGCIGIFDCLLTPVESNLLVLYIKELQQENKQQKDNWNKLKEYIKEEGFEIKTKEYGSLDVISKDVIIEKIQELEQGSENDG